MSRRLIQWDPLHVHIDATALQAMVGDKISLLFADGSLRAAMDLGGAQAVAAVALQAMNGGLTLSITITPPPFVDLSISGVEIVPEGIDLLLGKGGYDLPPKSSR